MDVHEPHFHVLSSGTPIPLHVAVDPVKLDEDELVPIFHGLQRLDLRFVSQ